MIYEPRDLPDLRDRVAAFYSTANGAILCPVDDWEDQSEPALEVRARWSLGKAARLRSAGALIHVSAHMTELLVQAREGIGDAGLMDFDLPHPSGIVMFGGVLPSNRRMGPYDLDEMTEDDLREASPEEWPSLLEVMRFRYVDETMLVWRTVPPSEVHEFGAVEIDWYVSRDSKRAHFDALKSAALRETDTSERQLDEMIAWYPEYVADGTVTIGFHPDAAELTVAREDSHGSWQDTRPDTFRALCYLLRQRVAEESEARPDRAARRRAAREGREVPPVRVISLRAASATGSGDGSRGYVHRWVVRGHWRRQWYRSIQGHRPVWITPYVKGPEDAPLLGGEKVYTVKAT